MPLFDDQKKSPIDRVRRSLYARRAPSVRDTRHDIHGSSDRNVSDEWASEKRNDAPRSLMPPHRRVYRIFFRVALVLFLLSIAVAAYSFFGGSVFVSSDNVDMTVTGPATVAGGDPTSFSVSVQNKNKTDIELVDLIADFPTGTKNPTAPTQDLGRQDVSLGTIKAGQVAQGQFQGIFFGAAGDTETIKFTVEYRTADSNAVFYKEKDVQVSLTSSPLSVSIDGLDSVNAGEPMTLIFTVSSNSTNIVNNAALQITYPFGWTTLSSDPTPSSGDTIWDLGDLPPGATTTVSVSGKIDGQQGDQDAIHATVGLADDQGAISTAIASTEHDVSIEKPFLATSLSLDGNTAASYAAPVGKTINAEVDWQNTGASRITNGQIVVALSGNALDPSSVETSDGYYDSRTNTITWDGGRIPSLALIAPGDSGQFHFSFASLGTISNTNNASIDLDLSAKGERIDESNVPQDISSELTQSVKIVSNLSLSSRAVHSSAVMSNTGPFPPKADQTSEYTVIWTAANTSNAVSGVKVSATLPPDVVFTGLVSPSDADVSYSSSTGSIIWNVGALPSSATSELDFQIALTPSAPQAGTAPSLVSGATITGTDDFAGVAVQSSAPSLTTLVSSDPAYLPGDDVVGQ
jgi:hypothetical protein